MLNTFESLIEFCRCRNNGQPQGVEFYNQNNGLIVAAPGRNAVMASPDISSETLPYRYPGLFSTTIEFKQNSAGLCDWISSIDISRDEKLIVAAGCGSKVSVWGVQYDKIHR